MGGQNKAEPSFPNKTPIPTIPLPSPEEPLASGQNKGNTGGIYASGGGGPGPTVPQPGRLAFATDRDGNREVYVMNADGNAQVNLTNNAAGNDSLPVWSPNGQKLAFETDRDGNREVYVMNADGNAQRL